MPRIVPLVAALTLVAGAARAEDDLVLDLGGVTLETRPVVHGTFTQGALPSDPTHEKDEEPAHQVTITHDFWMGKFPVTRGQFAKFVSDTRYVTDAEKGQSGGAGWDGKALVQKKDFSWRSPGFTQTDEHPVVLVTYGDATAFTGWASRKTGKRVRLPTEGEWEFAARGGTTAPWYGGSTESEVAAIGWFKSNAGNGTRPVGQKKANPLGLFDMSGNVFEWCRDVHGPYREGAAVDPELTTHTGSDTERRILRGGSWLRDMKRARSGARHRNSPGSRNADNGFRVVVTNDEAVGPGITGATTDFAPANPVGATGAAGSGGATSGAGPTAGTTGGRLANGEPSRVGPVARTSEGVSWGPLLVSPLGAASAVVAWMLLRRRRSGAVAATPPGVSTRVGDDGFFVRAPHVPAGSRARYECTVNGARVTDTVPLAGSETFVYTGSLPTSIRIVEISAAPRGGVRTPDRPQVAAGVDPGLIPPSSRPRPPPVPAPPRPVPPLAGSPRTLLYHPTTASHPESPGPIMASLLDDASSVRSSPSDAAPNDASPGEAPLSVAPMSAGPASAGPPSAAPTSVSPDEAFLGNPRAY